MTVSGPSPTAIIPTTPTTGLLEKPKPKPRKPGTPLDITGSSSYDLLSEKEKALCSNVRLFPQQYLLIKETLIRESLRTGFLKKASARQLIKIGLDLSLTLAY